ncbi:GTP cyclohydrolase I FolE [Catenovulum sp. 2E275]|uniref:GTP cyclohydrolase I FolE n=1 Tax=Catenovulum sp. 2E275 TaxID=2980497 RepID=UPI0021D2C23A|nr:GTP cyclohydrolase I FolE [Catenovulum sp. 2E275]MCU4675754.1 GTP cyclohydrolase I FolE [Catenovulum sp. 2E275]
MLSNEAKLVQKALIEHKLETPSVEPKLSSTQKIETIEQLMTQVLQTLELDLTDDSLADTPKRIAKMYVEEIFSGLDYTQFPKITTIENKMQVDEMIKVDEIAVNSTCEHHFITIDGLAKVAYIPAGKVIGLSKINRIVKFFARRPQVQERLTQQILVALQTLLETDNVAVSIKATHYCVKARGIMDMSSKTQTTALGGLFKTNPSTRSEFLAK